MFKRDLLILLITISTIVSCENSDTDFPEPEVTLFDKTWIISKPRITSLLPYLKRRGFDR
jgi:hypothetical protein